MEIWNQIPTLKTKIENFTKFLENLKIEKQKWKSNKNS